MRIHKDPSLVEAVAHPLRVRILEVLNEMDMTPTEFVDAGHADFFFERRPAARDVAYHFRVLAELHCLEPVDSRPSKGSISTTYRGTVRAEFIGSDWSDLGEEEKTRIVTTVLQGLIARIDGALMSETINSRDDRQVSWRAMRLDEPGWAQATKVLADAFHAVKLISEDSEARLKESEEPGTSTTAAILMFESPNPTIPTDASRLSL